MFNDFCAILLIKNEFNNVYAKNVKRAILRITLNYAELDFAIFFNFLYKRDVSGFVEKHFS